tara:strand:+ start:18 stop:1217 length:1200 start_codon:yes stop_codon:yes gene_type:complete
VPYVSGWELFSEAVIDIESLGLRIAHKPIPGTTPYAVVDGRSNARWWLVPLQSGRVAASGLALFQPLLSSAKLIKLAAVILSLIGLQRLWARQIVYIGGEPSLKECFSAKAGLSYAYFTGTDSPHRKIAVQVMDAQGRLLGFAKLSRNPVVAVLLKHEAAMLQRVQALALNSAHTPRVLFSGQQGGAQLLVTDTLKTAYTHSKTRFTAAHQDFLQELARLTALPQPLPVTELAAKFAVRVEPVRPRLEHAWCQRLEAAVTTLAAQPLQTLLTVGLSHGDFTPWNTFIVKGRLYVFDWEYAEEALPLSNDIIHFVLNQPNIRNLHSEQKLDTAFKALSAPWTGLATTELSTLVVIYLLTQILRQVERLPSDESHICDLDGAEEQAAMLDILLARNTGTVH